MNSWHEVAYHLALPIFFFYIGQELRLASKEKVASLISPVIAAVGGMIVPALIYLGLASAQHLPLRPFGAVIATDLPLALIALSLFPAHFAKRIRHYLLALAVADDLGSILVLALLFNAQIKVWWLIGQAFAIAALWFVRKNIWLALPIIAVSWWVSLNSGVQPTVIAALMGAIVTVESRTPFLILEKFSYFICIPFFLVAAFTDGITLVSLKPSGLGHGVAAALLIARIIGKPLGIFAGYLLAGRRTLKAPEITTISLLGIFGLSVSLLFIHIASTQSQLLASATKAIVYINLIALAIVLLWGARIRSRFRATE